MPQPGPSLTDSSRPTDSRWLTAAGLASLVGMAFLWLTNIPLGIPGEWTWNRFPVDAATIPGLCLGSFAACGYLAFVILAERRLALATLTSWEVTGWIIGLWMAAVAWIALVQETGPPAAQLGKSVFMLYYPSSSGYFHHVATHNESLSQFLAGYEDLMKEGDVLHVGTHPPGLFVLFHGLRGVLEASPSLAKTLIAIEPESVRQGFAILRESLQTRGTTLSEADEASLWGAAVLSLLSAAGVVGPLYGLLRYQLPQHRAFLLAAMWPTVPAVSLFWPKSDVAFPFLATLLVWLAGEAIRRRSMVFGLLTGLTGWLCLFLSLAFLPIGTFIAAVCIGLSGRDVIQHPRQHLPWLAALVLGFFGPVIALKFGYDHSLFTIWSWNYHNHAGFYRQFSRTYALWLLVNPVELAFAAGPAVCVASLSGAMTTKTIRSRSARIATIVGLSLWGLLWLSGKNSGEVARLWTLFIPGLIGLASLGLLAGNHGPRWRWLWLILQLGTCLLTVHRVSWLELGTPS